MITMLPLYGFLASYSQSCYRMNIFINDNSKFVFQHQSFLIGWINQLSIIKTNTLYYDALTYT